MLLTAEQSAQQRQKTIVDKDDIQSALAQARAIKNPNKNKCTNQTNKEAKWQNNRFLRAAISFVILDGNVYNPSFYLLKALSG